MFKNPWIVGGVAVLVLWWATRKAKASDGASASANLNTVPATSGGTLTTVDLAWTSQGADVLIDTTTLENKSAGLDHPIELSDPVSSALAYNSRVVLSPAPAYVAPIRPLSLKPVAPKTRLFIS